MISRGMVLLIGAMTIATSAYAMTTPVQIRQALVVGIGAYEGRILPNAGADAAELDVELKQLGFETIYARETTRSQLLTAVGQFATNLKGAQVGLFYFAGHAVQLRGHNYILPVGAQINDLSDLPREAIDLEIITTVMSQVQLQARIILLDACRNNPFPVSFMSGLPTSKDWVPGLAQPSILPPGMVIGFATALGATASDGHGDHSPYTQAILDNILEPGLLFDTFLQNVKDEVDATNPSQQPTRYGALQSAFYFRRPAVIQASFGGGDDDVYVTVNGVEVMVWSRDLRRARQIELNAGPNTLTVDVYNQHTKTGGLFPVAEGWNYSLSIKSSGSPGTAKAVVTNNLDLTLGDREDAPEMDGPHHGKRFRVASGVLLVDRRTGEITVSNLETDTAWK